MTNNHVDPKIKKIETTIEDCDQFTEEEVEILKSMVALWNAFQVLGKAANIARNIIIYVAGFFILWLMPFKDIMSVIKKYLGIE